MADQVTISTFLELRDNLSEGLRRVADAIAAATTGAPAAQAAINNIAKTAEAASRKMRSAKAEEERAAKEQERIALRQAKEIKKITDRRDRDKREQDRMQRRLADAAAKERERIEAGAAALAWKDLERTERIEYQKAKAAKRAAEEKALAEKRAIEKRERETQKLARRVIMLYRQEQREAVRLQAQVNLAMDRAAERRAAIAAREARDKKRIEERLTQAIWKEEQRRLIHAERMEAKKTRAAEKAARLQARAADKAAAARPGRLFGTMLSADLVSDFVTRGIPRAFGAIKDHFLKVADEGKEYEDSVNRIALSLAGLNISPSMRAATNEAEGLYGVLREMAAKLPGETEDYIRVYAQGLPDALTAGMKDTKKFAEFVSKYTAIAISRGVGSARAATDIEQILEGRARVTTRTYAELRPYIGMLAKDFNKLAPVERFERLQKAVDQAATGIGGLATTANAIFGEMESHIKEIYTIGEKPLFEAIKSTVSDLNDLFVKNRVEIMKTVNIIATDLGDAFRGIVPIIIDVTKRVADIINYIDESPTIKKILNFLSFQTLSVGASAREIGRTKRLGEETRAGVDILRKYASLIPATRGLPSQALDVYLEDLWISRAGTRGAMPGAIQSKEDWDAFVTAVTGNKDKAQELWNNLIATGDVKTMKMPDHRTIPADRARTYNDFRHSNFNIRQEFAEGFDPDRIAVAFASDLNRLSDMKLSAAYTLTGGVR